MGVGLKKKMQMYTVYMYTLNKVWHLQYLK